MAKQSTRLAAANELAQNNRGIHFKQLDAVAEVTSSVNVGTFPRLVKSQTEKIDSTITTQGVS